MVRRELIPHKTSKTSFFLSQNAIWLGFGQLFQEMGIGGISEGPRKIMDFDQKTTKNLFVKKNKKKFKKI